jgi:hypothetical protein
MVIAVMQQIIFRWIVLAMFGQVQHALNPEYGSKSQSRALDQRPVTITTDVTLSAIEVYDRPDETSYIVSTLNRGARVRVRGQVGVGWLAIDPPAASIYWLEGSAIDPDEASVGRNGHVAKPGVRADGVQRMEQPVKKVAETPAVYLVARYAASADQDPPLPSLPAAIADEIKSADAVHRSIRSNPAIAQWRFDTVRSTYQAILKKAGNDPHVEEAVRARLARVTRDERAAQAARTIDGILAESHRRDQEVSAQKRRVAAAGRSRARTFSAVGYMQASTEKIDGRKLYVLIGTDGSTLAYLDIPPGLDIDTLVAHRVGVRGDPHYNEELGTRLITVRDLEKMESRR